ncbi:MAG: tRNA lysidine(34) synthetase TilS [bacterium]|nr:tRNA lysidine(34) synthetase TilS [bacterium]
MIEPGDRVLAAVSGGPDSTALLLVLRDLRKVLDFELGVASFNHGLRKEAGGELEWVRKKALGLGLPFFPGKAEKDLKKKDARSPQERARRARYDFLGKTAGENGFNKIAFGHTATDQTETMLLGIIRGTGRSGLAGIPPRRPLSPKPGNSIMVIRPLLERTREEIVGYLREEKSGWREDRSNRDHKYLRNRIRGRIIPVIRKEAAPHLDKMVVRLAEILREEEEYLEALTREAWQKCRLAENRGVGLSVAGLGGLPPAIRRRVLRLAVSQVKENLPPPGWEVIRELEVISGPGRPARRLSLPGGVRAERVGDRLRFSIERKS